MILRFSSLIYIKVKLYKSSTSKFYMKYLHFFISQSLRMYDLHSCLRPPSNNHAFCSWRDQLNTIRMSLSVMLVFEESYLCYRNSDRVVFADRASPFSTCDFIDSGAESGNVCGLSIIHGPLPEPETQSRLLSH